MKARSCLFIHSLGDKTDMLVDNGYTCAIIMWQADQHQQCPCKEVSSSKITQQQSTTHSVWKNLKVFLALLGTFLAEPPMLLPLTGLPLLLMAPLLGGLLEVQ